MSTLDDLARRAAVREQQHRSTHPSPPRYLVPEPSVTAWCVHEDGSAHKIEADSDGLFTSCDWSE